MPDLSNSADAPPHSRHSVLAQLEHLHETGQPIVLRIDGVAEFVVHDESSFQRLCELVDRLETIHAVQEGLEDARHGRSRPLDELIEQKRDTYGP